MSGRVRRSVALVGLAVVSALGAAGCNEKQGSLEAFCAQLQRVPQITQPDDLTVPDPETATGNLVTELRRLREAAPAEIRGDVSVLVGVTEDVQTALSATDKASQEAAKQRVAASHEAWKAASDNVLTFASANCGFDPGTAVG